MILPSSSAERDDVVDEPDPKGLRRGEALGGQEVAARLPRADRLDDIRRDRRGDEAELRLGQRERRVLRGERDVAARDEARRRRRYAAPCTRAIVGFASR